MVSIYNIYNKNSHFYIGPDSTVTIFSIGSMFIFSVHYIMFVIGTLLSLFLIVSVLVNIGLVIVCYRLKRNRSVRGKVLLTIYYHLY